jgi:hypothetical protein
VFPRQWAQGKIRRPKMPSGALVIESHGQDLVARRFLTGEERRPLAADRGC